MTDRAARSEFLVEIVDAVNPVSGVHRERYAVEAYVANDTGKTLRVIRFASGPQDPVENRLSAHAALLQTVQVAFLAVRLAFDGVKGLALQAAVADAAGETGYVEHAIHGRATGAFADDLQSAIGTHSEKLRIGGAIHGLDEQIGESVDVLLLDRSLGRRFATVRGRSAAARRRVGRVVGRIVRRTSQTRHAAGRTVVVNARLYWLVDGLVVRRLSSIKH